MFINAILAFLLQMYEFFNNEIANFIFKNIDKFKLISKENKN